MENNNIINFPAQQLPFSRKNKKWRKTILDWADQKTFYNYELVRKSVLHKKINYDLINGILHMEDLEMTINPESVKAKYIPTKIQHYPIINSKLNVLRGEESKRVFDTKVIVTNFNAVSEIEKTKKEEVLQRMQDFIMSNAESEEQAQAELQQIGDYYTYEWQDMKEVRANSLLNHYTKELNISSIFNSGFMDAMVVGEEMYQIDIISGEPSIRKLNPQKVRIFRSGFSNRIEDADMIIIEDYWSPGKIIDTFYDVLTPKDIKYIENIPFADSSSVDSMGNLDERQGFLNRAFMGPEGIELTTDEFFNSPFNDNNVTSSDALPYDLSGNIKVLQVYWKSKRKIKKVTTYDPITGEEDFQFYPETYVIDEAKGEKEEIFWINEAWEGTKIGSDIYVNMRPRPIQYNRLSNPSRCHFGIIGSIYNLNDNKPFSLVDMMKPYSYLYDAIHDRLCKLIAKNYGPILEVDLAKVPKGWDIDKWLYFARINNIAVIDSFKAGEVGPATNKLVGGLNNASKGVLNMDLGNTIQQLTNLLEFIKMEMADVAGISKQREGQVSNRETVGGVERANLQSSYITEWLFIIHEDLKKRVLEAFLETAKIAMRGRVTKFQYILSDNSMRVMEIDGDEFAECDYGLVVDNSNSTQELNSKLDMLAQAALQNQTLNFSTIMKLYSSCSLAEKERIVEKNEQEMLQQRQQEMQQQQAMQQQALEAQAQQHEVEMQLKKEMNQRDNDTRIVTAEIAARGQVQAFTGKTYDNQVNAQLTKQELMEKMRQFDERIKLDREEFEHKKAKDNKDQELKKMQINKQNVNTSKSK